MSVQNNINWKRVLLFFTIAIVLSNIFRFDIFEIKPQLEELPTWIYIMCAVFLEGSGVLIGAIIAIIWFKKSRKKEITLLGQSSAYSFVMAIIPIILLTAIGIKNDFNLESHLYGFIAIIGTLIYCIMEEYGWRGYLQEELQSLSLWQKSLAIGFIWYVWHLSFLTEATIGENLFFFAMLVFGSWGIGQVADLTKSILASACFHLIIQIMMFNPLIKNGITGTEKIIILVISVGLWSLVIKKWKKEILASQNADEV